ncbi:DEKNAAC100105 [Brettanomyces naardenensis]|uniref:DEKNAAC100105 n=1 Tax=Brettanomyces naardenensis TaxID=13370 RepID=A0A448YER0_BRENA|nr:DEKNAAC100105 [Brettanomyces naardenensis]
MSFSFNLQSLQDSLQKTTKNLTTTLQDNFNNLPSADKVTSSLQTNLNSLGKEVSNLKPILKRTQRSLQEKFGSISDISELPKEYKDLEKQVDDLKAFYKRLLQITQQYEIESYDYPPNLRESLNEYTKLFNEKISGLSQATTTSEAEAVLMAPRKDQFPKTFSHQLSRVFKISRSEILSNTEEGSSKPETSLTKALLLVSNSEYKVGDERLEQDKLVISEFNNKLRNILRTDFGRADKMRRHVETSRLNFDTVRAEIKDTQKGDETVEIPEGQSKKLDRCEDELVNATEIAVEAMKELIKPEEALNLVNVFCKIQLNYHKNVADELSGLVDSLSTLPVDSRAEDDE